MQPGVPPTCETHGGEAFVRLPYADAAIVPPEKITLYLLNETHPDGRGKAAFFLHLGFKVDAHEMLQAALLRLVHSTEMTESAFAFGLKYVGIGLLICPDGRQVRVTSVWVLRGGRPPPYLVAAQPT